MKFLVLEKEVKLFEILPGVDELAVLEASGLTIEDGRCVVIFDNLGRAARIDPALTGVEGNEWLGDANGPIGFEDIVYSDRLRRFYCVIESVQIVGGGFRADLLAYDRDFALLTRQTLPFDLVAANKGFEGLAHIWRGDDEYLLALCEGNNCLGGVEGQQPGNGRIQIFRQVVGEWRYVGVLVIPPTAQFIDYAAVDVLNGQVVVLSQTSAQVWHGSLNPATWEFIDEGVVYDLPRNDRGEPLYCNAEGIAWVDDDRVMIVSDKNWNEAGGLCRERDQSIHLFSLPGDHG